MSFFEIASPLAARNIPVIPVQPGEKRCLLKSWQTEASTNPAQLQAWNNENPNFNVGCVAKPDKQLILDCDVIGLRQRIEAETGHKFPRTLIVKSAGKGAEHIYFEQTDRSRALGNRKQAGVFDLQSNDKYVVGPGSVYNGRKYEVTDDSPVAPCPDWLVDWIEKNSHDKPKPSNPDSSHGAPVVEDFCVEDLCDHYKLGGDWSGHYYVTDICPVIGHKHAGSVKTGFYFDGTSLGFHCFATGCPGHDMTARMVIKFLNQTHDPYPHPIWEEESFAEYADWIQDDEVPEDRSTAMPPKIWGFTDLDNARRFAWRYAGKFVFTKATGWLVYERGRWRRDSTLMAQQAMRKTLALTVMEAQLVKGTSKEDQEFRDAIEAHAKSCESKKKFNYAMSTAESMEEFVRDYSIFDQQADLFLCGNGTLNLKTGEFGSFDPRHLLTKGSKVNYVPTATCPKWEKFLMEVQEGKEHMVHYLARAVGYTLTTDTGGQCLFVPYGTGGTGKSQFLNVMRGVLGDYVFEADAELFMTKKGDSGQPFENAGMEGKRAVFAVETEPGKELATAKVKRMTGQDPIRASYKGKDHYTVIPVFKVWLATNDRPRIRGTDDAMWDRPKLIPFDKKFRGEPGEVKNIADVLLAEEASGILNWMLAGHAEWKEKGLDHPEEVKCAVKEWREEEDHLGEWLRENTAYTDSQREFINKKELFDDYVMFGGAEARGLNSRDFNEAMKHKGYRTDLKYVRGKNQRVWLNVKSTRIMGYSTGVMDNADAV